MRKGIATVSISGDLDEKLAAIARANFDGVEIFENDLITSPLSPWQVRRRAADLGLTIDLYQPFRDFEAVPPEMFAANMRRAERKFDLMEQLGATTLLVCSNVSESAIDDDALAAEQLHQLAERAHDRGFRIAYEALAWGRHVNDYRRSYQIAAAADHPHLGVCLDSFHILSRGADPAGIRQIPWEKIFFVQLSDAPHMAMDVLQWSRHYRCFPGQGGFDLPSFTEHVLAAGYRGPLSLEVFNDVFRRADPGRTAADAMRSLLFLEESLHTRLAAEEAGTASTRERVELFDPPKPARLTGHSFAEFSVDQDSASTMAGALTTLGFRRVGRHRSKPVDLWRQGGVCLLANSEADGRPVPGGPALAAIGVAADDQLRSANRADAFLARVLPRRRGPGEVYLPAVRAPGGTPLFFCAAGPDGAPAWLADFALDENAPDPDPGPDPVAGPLTHIDHVALSLPFDQYDEATLFYRAVLGLRPLESLELADPHGLIRSRALTNPDGTLRVVLNMPQLGGSEESGHVVPVHHLAFGCGDIFAAAKALRDHGMTSLPISDNYYDDLAARWELPDDLVSGLREFGVLYDRSPDGGEFFQLYTEMIGDRCFFEIVQRSGGYTGYGAANAATRMAAQR